MQRFVLCALFLCNIQLVCAQVPSYRARFRYILTQRRIDQLRKGCPSLIVTDALGKTAYNLCSVGVPSGRQPRIRALVTNDKGTLLLDPWSVRDDRVNKPCQARSDSTSVKKDPCYGTTGIINAAIDNDLRIQLPKRTRIGDPTIATWLHYQTWLFGVNAIGLKVRPRVKDDADSTYTRNAVSGTLNLGLNVGYSFGWTYFTHRSSHSYSITPGLNLGFSGVSLSKEPLKRKTTLTYIPSNFVFSPALSLIGARNDVGLIFTVGVDRMFGKYADVWLYQNKLFYGIGVSAGLKL
ncbi:hypothetical protein FY528_05325 [Hymenobacter lutimineralis]|uniref:Uncharacterized protein n=1 Tax=Hymenobacter lutimineralis TaxID=2606448 RepID=A0A5D6VBY1_9BACT|nr:hypothetical protein [Hymenobacter lutimineralis]TYZ12712.1 hypothetical protein FY528_05325 [Hymenobacter lutimineralis]